MHCIITYTLFNYYSDRLLDEGIWEVADWQLGQTIFGPAEVNTATSNILVLEHRYEGPPYRGGSVYTKRAFSYGSYRAEFSVPDTGGLVCGFFTYHRSDDNAPSYEIDVEILTGEPEHNKVMFTTWNGWLKGHDEWRNDEIHHDSNTVRVPGLDFRKLNTYGFDWSPGKVDFFVNDSRVDGWSNDSVPQTIQKIHLNIWTPVPTTVDPGGWDVPGAPPTSDGKLTVDSVRFTPYRGDAFVNCVVASEIISLFQDPVERCLGPPDDEAVALGDGGWIMLDMGCGEAIVDRDGPDLRVYENALGTIGWPEGYSVYGSNEPSGPWQLIGDGFGTQDFDLEAQSGLKMTRFILVVDDNWLPWTWPWEGYDIDAIEALNMEGSSTLLAETFASDTAGWLLVDQTDAGRPSDWFVDPDSGWLVQMSDIGTNDANHAGTYAVRDGFYLENGEFSCDLLSVDDGPVGLMFRVRDRDNFYRVRTNMAPEGDEVVLEKSTDGRVTVLARQGGRTVYPLDRWSHFHITMLHHKIVVGVDGDELLEVADDSILGGSIGLYSCTNAGSYYDNCTVRSIGLLPGDFNTDGDVDMADFPTFGASWLSKCGDAKWNAKCDIIPDGSINMADFAAVVQRWLTRN